MIRTCSGCGDEFTISQEDEELYEEGFIDHLSELCYYCSAESEQPDLDYEQFSDADPGL